MFGNTAGAPLLVDGQIEYLKVFNLKSLLEPFEGALFDESLPISLP